MSKKENSKKEKPTAERMDFGCKPAAMTPLERDAKLNTLKPPAVTPVRMKANDALKPVAMTPISSGEDRGLKPPAMTPPQSPAPTRPVNVPIQPKK